MIYISRKKKLEGMKKCPSKQINQIKMHVTKEIMWVWCINDDFIYLINNLFIYKIDRYFVAMLCQRNYLIGLYNNHKHFNSSLKLGYKLNIDENNLFTCSVWHYDCGFGKSVFYRRVVWWLTDKEVFIGHSTVSLDW